MAWWQKGRKSQPYGEDRNDPVFDLLNDADNEASYIEGESEFERLRRWLGPLVSDQDIWDYLTT